MARKGLIGMDKLKAKFAETLDVLEEAVKDAVKEGAEALRDGARKDAPRETGQLAEGIDIVYTTGGLVANVAERDPQRTHIARFHEEGTSSIPARPFMRPNAEKERRRLAKRVEQAVAKKLEGL